MARHILQGHIPIWLYGISYQGSLEAFSAAGLFALFGATPLMLKVEPFCWFCGFVWSHYLFAREVTDRATARLSTLVVAASPAFLTVWSVSVVGTYMSTLCLGTVALLLTARILRRGMSTPRLGAIGAVMGLAWWTFPLAIIYIVPIVLLLAVHVRKRAAFTNAACAPGGVHSRQPAVLAVQPDAQAGFAEVRSQIPHQTATVRSAVSGLLRRATPILLGARPSHGAADFFWAASLLPSRSRSSRWYWPCAGMSLSGASGGGRLMDVTLAFAVGGWALLLYLGSGWGYNAEEPILIPVYSVVYIVLLFGLPKRVRRCSRAHSSR